MGARMLGLAASTEIVQVTQLLVIALLFGTNYGDIIKKTTSTEPQTKSIQTKQY